MPVSPIPCRRQRRRDRLAILNGFGLALGDSIIGLQALDALKRLGILDGVAVTLFRRQPERNRLVAELYRAARHVDQVTPLPLRARGRPSPRVVNLVDFAFDPAFRGVAMIDYFLGRLGTAPALVPPTLKRNTWLAGAVPVKRPAGLPPRHALLAPRASMALRSMPALVHRQCLESLLAHQPWPVVTLHGRPPLADARVLAVPALATLAELCGLVASASLVVSTDTAIVHIADAFDVPCLAFFPTHRPEWRVRDYPDCQAVALGAALPEALEFARDEHDVAAAHAAWNGPAGAGGWLDTLIGRFCRSGPRLARIAAA